MKEKSVPTVLLLTTEYSGHISGGLGRHVTDLTTTGTKCGITFIVVTVSKENQESYRIENGVHVFRLLPWQKNSKDFLEYVLNLNFRFAQFVLQELHLSFNLIHAHDWLTGIAANQIKRSKRLPLITTIHATECGRKLGNLTSISERIVEYETMMVQGSDQVIVCSMYMKNVVRHEYNYPFQKIEVIPNGIIPENYEMIMEKEEALQSFSFIHSKFILAMGRLVKEKGFHLLIQAFSEIVNDYPDLLLVIAGTGPYEYELKQLTKKVSVTNKVIFTGFVQELERNTLLKNCEVLVIPSLYEPFGIIALEGMIAAKPILSFNIGGLGEILTENQGIIVPKTTSLCLAEMLGSYLTNPIKYRKIVTAGYNAANTRYNWASLIDETVELYKKMLDFY